MKLQLQIKSDLLEMLKDIDPYYFEKIILILLKKMGYGNFIETSKSKDGGIDGVINEDKLGLEKIYIQAKRSGQLHQNFKYLIRLGDNYCPTRLAVVLRLLQLS